MKNSNATPSKDTGAKNNNSDYDVDYQNSSKSENNCKTATSNKSSQRGTK